MFLVKYLRHPPSDLGYQGLYLFLRHWATIWSHFDNSLSIEDHSKILRRPSSKFQIQFFNKIRVSETLWTYFTGVNKCVINYYWALLGLLYYIMAIWFCWPFYAEPSIIQQNS